MSSFRCAPPAEWARRGCSRSCKPYPRSESAGDGLDRIEGTALVTGASAGLGEAFALALAARGHGLILTARRGDRLEALAARIVAEHGVPVTCIACDLAEPGAAARLIGEVSARGLDVRLLVNNAGFGLRGSFAAMDADGISRMIDLNCRAVADLSRLVLPGMIQMRGGAILNVASVAAFVPGPWMTAYYASKAFVLSFSEALHEEVRHQGVRVVALCPGPIATEFGAVSGLEDSAMFRRAAVDPQAVVRAGLKALDGNRAVALPGIGAKLVAASVRFTPRGIVRRLTGTFQKRR